MKDTKYKKNMKRKIKLKHKMDNLFRKRNRKCEEGKKTMNIVSKRKTKGKYICKLSHVKQGQGS